VDIPITESTQFFVEGRYQIAFTSSDDILSPELAFLESTQHGTIRDGLRFSL
jgi:hypothetical protein